MQPPAQKADGFLFWTAAAFQNGYSGIHYVEQVGITAVCQFFRFYITWIGSAPYFVYSILINQRSSNKHLNPLNTLTPPILTLPQK